MSKNAYKVDMPEDSYDDLSGQKGGKGAKIKDDFDDEDQENFDDYGNDFGVSDDLSKNRPISGKQPTQATTLASNSKQIPLGNKKPPAGPPLNLNSTKTPAQPGLAGSSSKPNFEKLKEGNLPGPKQKDPQFQTGSTKGESKPNLKIDPASFGKGPTATSFGGKSENSSKLFGMMSKPNLLVSAAATKSQGRPVYVGPDHPDYDPRTREQKVIDKAREYLDLQDPSSTEELKMYNKLGTEIFKEINEVLTKLVDRQKPVLFAQVQRNPSAKSTTRATMSMQETRKKNLFELEFASGEKLLASVRHELDEVMRQSEKMKDPLFFENLKQDVYDHETIVKEKTKELEALRTESKFLGRKIDSKDKCKTVRLPSHRTSPQEEGFGERCGYQGRERDACARYHQ